MKRCYIAGKIGNLPDAEWQGNFKQAREIVAAIGLEPVCPTCLPHKHDKSWSAYMREDLTALLSCDAIYAQSNWVSSPGARIEVRLARRLGIPVLYQSDFEQYHGVSPTMHKAMELLTAMGVDPEPVVATGQAVERGRDAQADRTRLQKLKREAQHVDGKPEQLPLF